MGNTSSNSSHRHTTNCVSEFTTSHHPKINTTSRRVKQPHADAEERVTPAWPFSGKKLQKNHTLSDEALTEKTSSLGSNSNVGSSFGDSSSSSPVGSPPTMNDDHQVHLMDNVKANKKFEKERQEQQQTQEQQQQQQQQLHSEQPRRRATTNASASMTSNLYNQWTGFQWTNFVPFLGGSGNDKSLALRPGKRGERSKAANVDTFDYQSFVEQQHRAFWELVQRILDRNDVVAMIRMVLDYLVHHMDASSCAVFLIDQNSHQMSRITRGQLESLSGITLEKGIAGHTKATKIPVCKQNFQEDEMYDAEIDLAQEFFNQKLLSVPLCEHGNVYAVVQATVSKPTRKEMDELHMKLLTWLGPILSSCMRKCIEFRDVLLSERTQKALLHIISCSDTEDTVLNLVDDVIAGACHITKAEQLSLFMVDWETKELWSLSSSYHEDTFRVPLDLSILGVAAKTEKTLNIFDPESDPQLRNLMSHRRASDTRCALYVPVGIQNVKTVGGSRPIAVLEIINKVDGDEFTFDDECAFEAFACEVAVILRRRKNEIEYIKLLADTRAEQVLAQRAKSQVNLLEAYTSYPSSVKGHPANCLRNSFLKGHSKECVICAGEDTQERHAETRSNGAIAHKSYNYQQHPDLYDLSGAITSGSRVPSWDFNVFTADMDSLPQLIEYMYLDFNMDETLGVSASTLRNFILAVKDHYHPNPFHNFLHAFSVVHVSYMLLSTTAASKMLQPLDIAACLIASLGHDVDHPGHTNAFEVRSGSQLALVYSDESVLERHHVYTTFRIISKTKNANILQNLSAADYRHVRKVIITAILGTDMANHFKFCEALEKVVHPAAHHLHHANSITSAKRENKNMENIPVGGEKGAAATEILSVLRESVCQSDGSGATTPRGSGSMGKPPLRPREVHTGWVFNGTIDDRIFLVKTLVHASDLSGQTFPKPIALTWSNMIAKEFAYQALLEQAENIPVSYQHIDDPVQMVEGQLFFAQKIVAPLWDLMYAMFPELEERVTNLADNVTHYEQELQRLQLAQAEEVRAVCDPDRRELMLNRRDSICCDDEGVAVPGLAKCTPAKFNSFRTILEGEVDDRHNAECDKLLAENDSFTVNAMAAVMRSRQNSMARSRLDSTMSRSSSDADLEATEVIDVDGCPALRQKRL